MKQVPVDDFSTREMRGQDQFCIWIDSKEVIHCHPSWGKLTAEQWCKRECQRVWRMWPDMRVAVRTRYSHTRWCIWMPGLWSDEGGEQ